MDTEKLKIFLQIVEIGSINGAARQLNTTRSALRRVVDVLEEDVGAPLLHRDATGVKLTSAGDVLVRQGQTVVASARELTENAREASVHATGVIRILEPVGLPLALHVKVILAAHLSLPGLRMVIRHLENPVASLHEPFEVMLHEGAAPDGNLWFSRVILRVPLQLAASRDYLAHRGAPATVSELAEHDTLGWNRPGSPGELWPLLAGGSVTVTPWFSSADPHLIATLATQGGGIFLAPRMPFFDGPETETLQPVLEDLIGGELVFRVTTPFPSRADARTRDTLRLILQHLEGLFPE